MRSLEIIKEIHKEFKCTYYQNRRDTLKCIKGKYLIIIDIVRESGTNREVLRLLRYLIGDSNPYCKEQYLYVDDYTRDNMQLLIDDLVSAY